MKRPNVWRDAFTMAAAIAFPYALAGMGFYYLRAKYDSSMEQMWTWKRQFYVYVLGISFVLGLPFWVVFVRRVLKNRRER